jgi:hypothetical protein
MSDDEPSPGWAPPNPRDLSPSAPPPRTKPGDRWVGRTAAGLPVRVWLGVGVVAIGGIVAGAVALGEDEGAPKLAIDLTDLSVPGSVAPDRGAPDGTVAHVPGTAPTGAPDTAPGTAPRSAPDSAPDPGRAPDTAPASTAGTVPELPSVADGSAPSAPLPAGDPEVSTFEYADSFGSAWSGTIGGVVEVPVLGADDSTGLRCFVVIGTLTPEAVEGLVSDSWSTPYVTLFVDGDEADLSDATCATGDLAAAGYRSMFEANVTLGTEFAFYTEFSLAASAGDPQAVAVGQDDSEWLFFDARLLDRAPPTEVGAVGPLPVDPAPVGDGTPGAFVHADDYSGDGWSGSIVGLVEVPTDSAAELPGRCFVVIATLTADVAGSGVFTSPYAAPPIALIADGRLIDDYYGCSNVEAEAAGYRWFYDAEITPGTSVAVYATLLVPEPLPGDLQAIVVGDAWGGDATVMAPHVLADLAPAAIAPGPPPGGDLTPTATPFVVAQEGEAASWDAIVHGYVADDCTVVYASFTLAVGSSEPLPPEVFLVAGGRLLPEEFDCGTDAARAAGYVEQWSRGGRVGQPIHVYAAYRIPPELGPPQAVVIGRAGLGDQVVVAATELDAIPSIPG